MLEIMSDGLRKAMAEAKNILFVAAAGNSDTDVDFDQTIPSSFDLPNLMVVGAVDQAGDPTGFTSQGKNVRLYANGFEVESYVPGGGRMAARELPCRPRGGQSRGEDPRRGARR